jgi:hypothetical protein
MGHPIGCMSRSGTTHRLCEQTWDDPDEFCNGWDIPLLSRADMGQPTWVSQIMGHPIGCTSRSGTSHGLYGQKWDDPHGFRQEWDIPWVARAEVGHPMGCTGRSGTTHMGFANNGTSHGLHGQKWDDPHGFRKEWDILQLAMLHQFCKVWTMRLRLRQQRVTKAKGYICTCKIFTFC